MVTSWVSTMLPSFTVTNSWVTLQDAANWAGLDDGTLRAFNRQLGDPNNTSMQILAVLPEEMLKPAIDAATKGARYLNPIEKAQLFLMINSIRQKFGGPPLFTATAVGTVTHGASVATAVGPSKIRIKLSQVIDQGSDMEIEQLDAAMLLRFRKAYSISEGDNPLEREEVTDAQISALHAKVEQGLAPFVDMGVWGAFGERLARQMKFTSQVLKDGQWKAVELPGASSLLSWEDSWRIFRTTAIMIGLASTAVLDRYASEFKQRCQEYPDCWHLAAQADIRCRSEWWMQEKRRQEDFHDAHPTMSAFNVAQPWNSVIKASAGAQDFWHKEFEKPAMLYKVNGPKAMPAIPIPPKPGNYRSDPVDDKRQHEPRRRDGRYFKSMGGVNICYDWTRNENGCKNEGCEKQMAHVCEWCRQPHKSINCPQVPGWTQDSGRPDKGKGKGKGKKGGRPNKRARHM